MVQPVSEYELHAAEALRRDAVATEQGKTPTFGELAALGVRLLNEFKQAEADRQEVETRWMKDLRQFRGIYEPDVLTKIGNRSKAFVRKTRVKIKTVDARMLDLLFPANAERNWSIDSTPVPSVAPEFKQTVVAQLVQELTAAAQQIAQQGQAPQPGQAAEQAPAAIEEVKPTRGQVIDALRKAVGKSAKQMADVLDDQLTEARYRKVAKEVLHSGNLFGTGVLKGPLVERKTRTRYLQKKGKWTAADESYVVPFVDHVPLWKFYPDMGAVEIDDCRYVYERHQMTRAAILALADRPKFDKRKIVDYVQARPDGEVRARDFDFQLRALGERGSLNTAATGLYEIYERWGWLTAQDLKDCGVKIAQGREHESFFATVWLLPTGDVVRASLQPINGVRYPYHIYYFEKDETSLFGEGVASIMRDDQDMINSGTRMMLDNAAVCAGPQFEVNTNAISTRERLDEMHPFKIWKRSGADAQYPAIRVLEVPGHIEELAAITDRFDVNADETTAIPRYMSGENATQGAAGTAAGMSMLLGAANIVLKDLVVNFDEGVTRPFITSLYRWNMRFHPNNAIKGDYDVKARGASSLVAKEIRAQSLATFAMSLQPEERMLVKWEDMVRARAEALDLSDVIKSAEEAEADMQNPQVVQQQQMALRQQQAVIAELEARVGKLIADAARSNAAAMQSKVTAAYEAMQAAGVAVTNPHIAAGADEVLQSVGWQDATPQNPIAGIAPAVAQAAPPMAATAGVGKQAGIETAALA